MSVEEIRSEQPDLVMIDSIQTMNHTDLNSSPGSVTQVRECTNAMMRCAKSLDIPILVVGHVNKDGAIAGPKVLEHIVDAVLYFEGDRQHDLPHPAGGQKPLRLHQRDRRVRHGGERPATGEQPLPGHVVRQAEGCVAAPASPAVMEGTRPILAEIQGLATTSGYGNPRRMATGFDYNRMALILAVLEKRAGYYFSNLDAYINVVGGLRLDEPSVDLAVAMSLISSLKDTPIREDTVVFGEIGLAGELRSVNHVDQRIGEAARLGFTRCVLPYHSLKNLGASRTQGMEIIGAKNIREAFEAAT